MTNVEALKQLYTDLGGDAAEVESCTTVAEVIPKLSEVAGGGGSNLPEVTAEDNGDVLTVVDGAWDKATPAGGALIINPDIETLTLNKTWKEIYDTIKGGNMAVIVSEREEGGQIVGQDVDIIIYATLDTGVIPNEYIIGTGNSYVYKTNSPDGYPAAVE